MSADEYYWLTFQNYPWRRHVSAFPEGNRPCGEEGTDAFQRLCAACARKYGIEW